MWVGISDGEFILDGEEMFPSPFKKELVYPLLKKPSLNLTVLDNFCIVFHLPFLEKVVALQLQRILGWII